MVFEYRGIDGNKKINGRKRQILVDVLGRLWKVKVHAAHQHDSMVVQFIDRRILFILNYDFSYKMTLVSNQLHKIKPVRKIMDMDES